jgi:PAS domain S-box-containing protein
VETESDQLLNSKDPEKPFRGGFGRSQGSGSRFGEVCGFSVILLFLILFFVFASDDVERSSESYSLLLFSNALFLGVLPLVSSYLSLRAYLASGNRTLLMLGNGTLSLGLGSTLAALTPFFGGGPNTIVTMHNTAALLSAIFNLSGAACALVGSQKHLIPEHRRLYVGLSVALIVLFFASLLFGVLQGLTPTFFVQGVGPTYLRQLILGISIGCFTISAAVIASVFAISRSRFLQWYWMALALMATGLLCVFAQKSVGSDVGWLGRAAQYVGGGYLLVAVLVASRDLRDRNLDFLSHLWTFFFNRLELKVAERTRELVEANERLSLEMAARKQAEDSLSESEKTFRSMFENSLDGIMFTAPDGAIFKANKAACSILGRSEQEICNLGRDFVVDTNDPRLLPTLNERSQRGHFRGELNYRRKDGTTFPVELTSAVYRDAKGNLRTSTIFRDISERKRMEEDLRKARDELEERVAERTAELNTTNENLSLEIVERKRAEEELQATLNRFYSILSNQYGSLLLVAEDGRIEFANQTFCDQFELEVPRSALQGLTPQDIIQQIQHVYADPAQAVDRIREIIQLEQPVREEEIAIRGGRTYLRDFIPIWIDGKLYGRLWHHRDISDQKRSEEKLRESEERLSLTLQVSNAGRWEWNVGSDEVSFDERFHAMLGYTMGELPTSLQEWLLFHHPGDMPTWMSKAEAYLRGDSPLYESEHRIRGKDGSWKWVFTRGKLANLSTTGYPKQFIGMAIDVTERKHSEETLRESEARFRSYFDLPLTGMAITSVDKGWLEINDRLCEILGYSREELRQKTWAELTHPDDMAADVTQFERVLRREIDGYSLEKRFVRSDGQVVPTILSVAIVRETDARQEYFVTLIQDITDRKRAEEELESSLQEKELLLKEIHHRVKNNLQIISSLLNLQSRHIGDEKLEGMFQECQDRITAMASVHSLLYKSRNFAEIDFGDYVRAMANQLFRSYTPRAATISLVIHVENVMLRIDTAIPCGLIISELVTNALKYAFRGIQGGEIKIEIEATEEGLRLLLEDNGIGFPKDVDFCNTGTFGLRLVHMLVKQLDGSIEQFKNNGTRYVIML